ncbi:MAG: polysaccharide deacetylase family protein [Clostridiales bacterium]|nr:polysaccharide deacetylase family protein [Clostridiales bacterium]
MRISEKHYGKTAVLKIIYALFLTFLLVFAAKTAVYSLEPNEMGEIMIVMYHGLRPYPPKENYLCSISDFKSDMQMLYDNGYRLISLADLLDNNIKVEKGCTPIVLTFDDGYSTAFSLEEKNGKLVTAADCCVDIINKFNETHPGFGRAGVFYICDYQGQEPFYGAGTMKQRLTALVEMGYELGNHTGSHSYLNKLNKESIMKDMTDVEKLVADSLPGYKMRSAAYPYGSVPNKSYQDVMLKGKFGEIEYEYDVAFREKMVGGSTLPYSVEHNKLFAPRVRGSNNAVWDLGWYVRHYDKNPDERFVSDGEPDVITVPARYAQKLDVWKCLNKTLKIVE